MTPFGFKNNGSTSGRVMTESFKAGQDRIMYRTGAAARLAGLPVETLRVWERRYSLSDAQRSERG
ncbi:MerR family transcriptional regulator, partial [Stenotrophomonas maltophilia]|uniref:MerR family transcriptional regulator n=1 Tax=Stenotrophomonas maltophilia TaxID=40324 RepID=UPI001954BC6F